MRYKPDTRTRPLSLSRKTDTNPFRELGRFQECQLIPKEELRPHPFLLNTLMHEEKIKRITHRVTRPTIASSCRNGRRESMGHLNLEWSMKIKDNSKLFCDKINTTNLHNKDGTLRSMGTRRFNPLLIADINQGPDRAQRMPHTGELYNIACDRSVNWENFQKTWKRNPRNRSTLLQSKKPRGLGNYSIYNSK